MIISNSSCLIIFDKLGILDLLEKIYGEITIPRTVRDEVFASQIVPNWIEVIDVTQPVAYRILEKTLGPGESEAIALSLESNPDLLILDDLTARKIAQRLGIKITGVIGILLEAKRIGLITEIKKLLDEILKLDFRISKAIYDEALRLAKGK